MVMILIIKLERINDSALVSENLTGEMICARN
jgi:hypothetical protein